MHDTVQPIPISNKDATRRDSITSQKLDKSNIYLTDLPLPITDYELSGPQSLVLPPPVDFAILDTFLPQSNKNDHVHDDIESYILPPPPLDNEHQYNVLSNRFDLNERYDNRNPYHHRQDTFNIPMTLNISIRPELPFNQNNQFIQPQNDTYHLNQPAPLEIHPSTSKQTQFKDFYSTPPQILPETDNMYREIRSNKPTTDTYVTDADKFALNNAKTVHFDSKTLPVTKSSSIIQSSQNLQTISTTSEIPPPLPSTMPPPLMSTIPSMISTRSSSTTLPSSFLKKTPPPLPLTKPPVLQKLKPPVPAKPKSSISKSCDNLVDINNQSSITSNYLLDNNTNSTNLHAQLRNNSFKRHSVAIPREKVIKNNNKRRVSKLVCAVI